MRKSRFYQISGNFRSGILSPAAQDDITREDWLNGAAELTNFDILRDGGIRTRPRLERGPRVPALTRWVLDDSNAAHVPNKPAGGWWFSTDSADQGIGARPLLRDGTPFLTLELPGRHSDVRAVLLEDVRLRQGPWQVGGELVFGVDVLADRVPGGTPVWSPIDLRPDESDTLVPYTGGNPYSRYAFAPGRVRRDVAVQIPTEVSLQYRRTQKMRFKVRIDPASDNGRELALRTLELRIAGARAFDSRDPDRPPPSVRQYQSTLGVRNVEEGEQAWRIIPWTLRHLDLALVIGMEKMVVVGAERTKTPWTPAIVVPEDNAWFFTRDQLREMTWAAYGSHLILSHVEFPYPLEVRLSGTGQLAVDYLQLVNLPQLPARLAPEARLDVRTDDEGRIVLDQPEPAQGAATRAVPPTNVVGRATVGGAVLGWDDVGADRYRVYWQTRVQYNARLASDQDLWTGTGVSTMTVETNAAIVPGLLGGTEYQFAVVSVVAQGRPNALAGETDPEDADDLFLTVLVAPLPAPVLSGTASTTADGTVNLTWTVPLGARTFRLEVRVGTGAWVDSAQQPAPNAFFRPRLTYAGTPGTTYSFRLYANAPNRNESAASNVITVGVARLAPARPRPFTTTYDPNVNGRVTLTVPAAANAESYDWQVASDSAFADLELDTNQSSRTLAMTWPRVGSGWTQRYVRVRSVRITADGPQRSAWRSTSFTPRWVPFPDKPTNLRTASIAGLNGIHWTWPTYGAGLYQGNPDWEVQFGPRDPAQPWFGIETNPSGTVPARAFSNANGVQTAGQRYRVRVRAAHLQASPPIRSPWSDTLNYTVPG